jgi:toxin ParE1/3/4
MGHVYRFRQAEQDLLAIADHIAKDNATAAIRWLIEIEEKLTFLATQPYAGQAVPDLRQGLRRYTHGSYVIFYEPRESGIVLVRVLHGARKIEDLF